MHTNINIENAVEHLKTLVDSNRCYTCDQLNGPILRYPCGHSVCNDCITTAVDCLLCLSPPKISLNFPDVPSSKRVEHVSNLLTAFQDLFQLDVYKRHRLSEQLKLEKQLFPECIQAPSKYFNKRKSIKASEKNKENLHFSFLPGEGTSRSIKMDNTNSYVQQWLNRNSTSLTESNISLPRKPFTDLNVNGQNQTKYQSPSLISKDKNIRISTRKRTHIKVFNSSSKKKSKQLTKKKKESIDAGYESLRNKENSNVYGNILENDESGIVIDEDAIIIDDSQRECADKDKMALMAVKEAEKFNICDITSFDDTDSGDVTFKNKMPTSPIHLNITSKKVPFYKKSLLHKICSECNNERILQNKNNSRNFTVTIDNNNFITTIKVSQCPESNVRVFNKQSVEIQADLNMNRNNQTINLCDKIGMDNDKIFTNTNQNNIKTSDSLYDLNNVTTNVTEKNVNKLEILGEKTKPSLKRAKCLVIEDSDTDSDSNGKENTVEVTAEVHRSETFDDYGVLTSLEANEYENRMRHAVREHTPLSTDSSDKENYDPNRIKRQKLGKKCYSKK